VGKKLVIVLFTIVNSLYVIDFINLKETDQIMTIMLQSQ